MRYNKIIQLDEFGKLQTSPGSYHPARHRAFQEAPNACFQKTHPAGQQLFKIIAMGQFAFLWTS
jgi:hypothetical protein